MNKDQSLYKMFYLLLIVLIMTLSSCIFNSTNDSSVIDNNPQPTPTDDEAQLFAQILDFSKNEVINYANPAINSSLPIYLNQAIADKLKKKQYVIKYALVCPDKTIRYDNPITFTQNNLSKPQMISFIPAKTGSCKLQFTINGIDIPNKLNINVGDRVVQFVQSDADDYSHVKNMDYTATLKLTSNVDSDLFRVQISSTNNVCITSVNNPIGDLCLVNPICLISVNSPCMIHYKIQDNSDTNTDNKFMIDATVKESVISGYGLSDTYSGYSCMENNKILLLGDRYFPVSAPPPALVCDSTSSTPNTGNFSFVIQNTDPVDAKDSAMHDLHFMNDQTQSVPDISVNTLKLFNFNLASDGNTLWKSVTGHFNFSKTNITNVISDQVTIYNNNATNYMRFVDPIDNSKLFTKTIILHSLHLEELLKIKLYNWPLTPPRLFVQACIQDGVGNCLNYSYSNLKANNIEVYVDDHAVADKDNPSNPLMSDINPQLHTIKFKLSANSDTTKNFKIRFGVQNNDSIDTALAPQLNLQLQPMNFNFYPKERRVIPGHSSDQCDASVTSWKNDIYHRNVFYLTVRTNDIKQEGVYRIKLLPSNSNPNMILKLYQVTKYVPPFSELSTAMDTVNYDKTKLCDLIADANKSFADSQCKYHISSKSDVALSSQAVIKAFVQAAPVMQGTSPDVAISLYNDQDQEMVNSRMHIITEPLSQDIEIDLSHDEKFQEHMFTTPNTESELHFVRTYITFNKSGFDYKSLITNHNKSTEFYYATGDSKGRRDILCKTGGYADIKQGVSPTKDNDFQCAGYDNKTHDIDYFYQDSNELMSSESFNNIFESSAFIYNNSPLWLNTYPDTTQDDNFTFKYCKNGIFKLYNFPKKNLLSINADLVPEFNIFSTRVWQNFRSNGFTYHSYPMLYAYMRYLWNFDSGTIKYSYDSKGGIYMPLLISSKFSNLPTEMKTINDDELKLSTGITKAHYIFPFDAQSFTFTFYYAASATDFNSKYWHNDEYMGATYFAFSSDKKNHQYTMVEPKYMTNNSSNFLIDSSDCKIDVSSSSWWVGPAIWLIHADSQLTGGYLYAPNKESLTCNDNGKDDINHPKKDLSAGNVLEYSASLATQKSILSTDITNNNKICMWSSNLTKLNATDNDVSNAYTTQDLLKPSADGGC